MKIFKPTSIIFLIVSAVLVVSGVIMCFVGYGIAKDRDISAFSGYVDDEGNSLNSIDFSGKTIKNISLEFEDCDVYIIGNYSKSGAETVNFAASEYEYSLTNNEFSVNDANIFSIFHITESGSNFSGIRHYFISPFLLNDSKAIRIFLSDDQKSISKFNIRVKNGNVNFENISLNSNYFLNVENGNISLSHIKTSGTCDIQVKNGNIILKSNDITGTKAYITENGNINCDVNTQYSFSCKCEKGIVSLDSQNIGAEYQGVYPAKMNSDTEQNDNNKDKNGSDNKEDSDTKDNLSNTVKLPCAFFAKVKKGNIEIRYTSS